MDTSICSTTAAAPATQLLQARYGSLTDKMPRVFQGTWADTREFYSAHRRAAVKGGPLHNFAELRSAMTRANENVVRLHLILKDVDHGDRGKFLESWRLLKGSGAVCFISSTWSHRPEAPRLRVGMLPSRPILRDEWLTVWDAVNTRFKLHADTKSRDAAHFFYDPSCPPDVAPFFWAQDGEPLDVDAILRDAPPVTYAPARTGLEWYESIETIPDGRRDNTLASVAGILFRSNLPPELSYSLLRAVNAARCKPPLSDQQVTKIATSIARKEAARGSR